MSFYVNATQEETFQYVMNYFKGRRMKILTSSSPSHIRVEFGSWRAHETFGYEYEKGEAEASITRSNGGSYVNLNLDFMKVYLVFLAVLLPIVIVVTVVFYEMLAIPFFRNTLIVILVIIMPLCLAAVRYVVSKTRKRFIEEFNMFIQSLASKED